MRYLIWDFDGTLGYRVASWSSLLAEISNREFPNLNRTASDFRPYLLNGFPWHQPEQPHQSNRAADAWWDDLNPVFWRAFLAMGLPIDDARRLAGHVRGQFVDTQQWRLFDDTIPTLNSLSGQGWQHVVLSNHVPELPKIINALGLSPYVTAIFNSAATGFEKPHPRAFLGVLETLHGVTDVWMIGDNPSADIAGAEAVGLRAVLVRKSAPGVKYHTETLARLVDMVNAVPVTHELGVRH
ncbi:MAG: HAD family hydrolase [Bacillota bacterium]